MIHIATVHWQSDRWIATQQAYFRKHLRSPHRLYGWLNDIPDASRDGFFYTTAEDIGPHAIKLNLLGDMICLCANDDDLLIFVDGDAFPIGDIEAFARAKLPEHELIAVVRAENRGDVQPHPCFCVTTAGFWKRLGGDWKSGYTWKNSAGRDVTDVGGNLLKQLEDRHVRWLPLLRSNKRDAHPLFFGIYGDLVYHHGSGFRNVWSRTDENDFKQAWKELNEQGGTAMQLVRSVTRARDKMKQRRREENALLSETIFKKIQEDPLFYEEFLRAE